VPLLTLLLDGLQLLLEDLQVALLLLLRLLLAGLLRSPSIE
jgi:hypothetical protein